MQKAGIGVGITQNLGYNAVRNVPPGRWIDKPEVAEKASRRLLSANWLAEHKALPVPSALPVDLRPCPAPPPSSPSLFSHSLHKISSRECIDANVSSSQGV